MKLCVDCKWCESLGYGELTVTHWCHRNKKEYISPVTGKKAVGGIDYCSVERCLLEDIHCGDEGRFWEKKDGTETE